MDLTWRLHSSSLLIEMVAQRQVAGFETGRSERCRPAPWRQQGDGFVLLYHLPRELVLSQGLVPAELEGKFVGGTCALILTDYRRTNIGPYRELLFIPGRFEWEGRTHYVASRVYSSTEASVSSGRDNWGLPRQRAQFYYDRCRNTERVSVGLNGKIFADLTFRAGRIGLPVTTELVPPARRTLLQPLTGQVFLTAPEGRGSLRRAKLVDATFDGAIFPDISSLEPKMTLKVVDFDVLFPESVVTR